MAYQLWPPGQEIAFGSCVLGSDICKVLSGGFDPGPWFAGYGVVGLAVTVAGAAQLFVVLYHPPRLDPGHGSEDVSLRRLFARAVDALVLLGGVWFVVKVFGWVERGTAGGWLLSAGLVLLAFLYEGLPLARREGRTVGKFLLRLRVVPARDDERLRWGRVVARAAGA